MHVECGHALLSSTLKFSTMHCRKMQLVPIDFEVGVLRTFLASMTAKVHLYQKDVSVFLCLHVKTDTFLHFSSIHFQSIQFNY